MDGRKGLRLVQDAIDEHLIGGRVPAFCAIEFVAQQLEPGRTLNNTMDGRSWSRFQSS
jgi:hypothetical protein